MFRMKQHSVHPVPVSLRWMMITAFLWFLSAGHLIAQDSSAPVEDRPSPALKGRLMPLIEAHRGRVAVKIRHLTTGESFAHNDTVPMPTASLIKLPVMVETYRQVQSGRLDLNQRLTLREENKVQGSGILTTHFSAGLNLTLRDAVRLMIAYSDNTATNLVVDQIGLPATTAAMTELKLPDTRLHAKVFRTETSLDPARSREFGLGSTTAQQMSTLLEQLERRQLAGLKPEYCEEMRTHLAHCESKSMLPRHLPAGAKIAHKTGSVSAVRTDAGLLQTTSGPVAVCVLTAGNQDQRWTDDNEAEVLIAEIGRQVWEHFQQGDAVAEDGMPLDVLRLGSAGELVAALQRTLNARLTPSPELTVDGEFGRATQRAVQEFQKQNRLTVDGVVSARTWSALSPILLDESAPESPSTTPSAPPMPEVKPGLEPRDSLDGPPFVTASAWAVGDAETGAVLWGDRSDRQMEMASTTKIMTALVALQLARQHKGLLDETITFSKTADAIEGSSAGLRAGERITLRNLLYGLMLPSGNDAAQAIAESLGNRFAPAGSTGKNKTSRRAGPVAHFVAQMNHTAETLGLKQTRFRNPHGLPADGHMSSAADLIQIAAAALREPLFRDIAGTREHKVRVTSTSGYSRDITWKTTNRLLDIAGYQGIKTGWTLDAGACLVALGDRGSDELIVVVLGSSSASARYADTRNLFRWSWHQRGHER